MRQIVTLCKKELLCYFQTPLAYVFAVVFLIANGGLTFYLGNYFERGIADLKPFFLWHPWLYLFLVPAISMRLWAEEQRSGTIEFLTTLPVSWSSLVLGKFLAGWLFLCGVLLCTFPIWITANYLGNPDNGVILTSYIGSALMAGVYLAISSAASAMTRNQVIAFIIALMLCLFFVMAGYPLVISFIKEWLPAFLVTSIADLSILTNMEDITHGVLRASSIVYFISMIALWLYLTVCILTYRINGVR
jgi:ABC-2 type transport system permease protein